MKEKELINVCLDHIEHAFNIECSFWHAEELAFCLYDLYVYFQDKLIDID